MAAMRRHADEADRADTVGLGREAVAGGAVEARGLCCAHPAGRTVVQNLVEVINAAASAYGSLTLHRRARQIGLQRFVIDQLAARLRE